MDEAWRTRLTEALAQRKMSKRAASLAAGLAPGYVHSLLVEGKEPSVFNLEAVCKAVGVSLQYLLYGYHVSPATARLLQLMEEHPDRRDAVLAIFGARDQD